MGGRSSAPRQRRPSGRGGSAQSARSRRGPQPVAEPRRSAARCAASGPPRRSRSGRGAARAGSRAPGRAAPALGEPRSVSAAGAGRAGAPQRAPSSASSARRRVRGRPARRRRRRTRPRPAPPAQRQHDADASAWDARRRRQPARPRGVGCRPLRGRPPSARSAAAASPARASAPLSAGCERAGESAGRRVEGHPADAGEETSTHEWASMSRTTYSSRLASASPARTGGDPGGHAAHAQQQRHRAREVLAVAAALEQEVSSGSAARGGRS